MHSTLKLRESDPHDIFAIEPEVVPVAWADKVLADITRDTGNRASDQPPSAASGAAAIAPVVDTTFRATAVDDLQVANDRPIDPAPSSKWVKSAVMLMLTLCSAAAAAGWQHYGDTAKQMIAGWAPAFALSSSPPPQSTGLAEQPATPAVQAAAAEPAPPQNETPAPQAQSVAPAAADTAQLQSMARDLAGLGQQVEQLKASLAELKAAQQAMAVVRPSEVKSSETKTFEARSSDVRTSAPNPRPKISPPPPRVAAASARRPMPGYAAPVQAATAPPPMPLGTTPSATWQPPPPLAEARETDGEPVVRPPMPMR